MAVSKCRAAAARDNERRSNNGARQVSVGSAYHTGTIGGTPSTMDYSTRNPESTHKLSKKALKKRKALGEHGNLERQPKKPKSEFVQSMLKAATPSSCVSTCLKQELSKFRQASDKENLENQPDVAGSKKHKKERERVVDAHRTPLSPRKPVQRSTSAAAAMAKIASINAQKTTAATHGKVSMTPLERYSFGHTVYEEDLMNSPRSQSSLQEDIPKADKDDCRRRSSFHNEDSIRISPSPVSDSRAKSVPETGDKSPTPSRDPSVSQSRDDPAPQPCDSVSQCNSERLQRYSDSEKMALEAQRLQANAQKDAERASLEAKRLNQKEEAERRAAELELAVMNLAKQMQAMQQNKALQDQQMRKQLGQAPILHDLQRELQKFKAESATLKKTVETLQHKVDMYKEDNDLKEKKLQHEKEVNRRLSARLSGQFLPTDPSAPKDVVQEEDDLLDAFADAEARGRDSSNWETKSVDACTSPIASRDADISADQLATPRYAQRSVSAPRHPQRSSSVLPVGDAADSPVSSIKVPVLTPSRARAPAIYNEPRNRTKQHEYAAHLEQQISEQKERRRLQSRMEHANTAEYFPFGRPGSGAPVRDVHSNVVANVTFTRSKRPLPLDHPAGAIFAQRSSSAEMLKGRR